MYNRDNRGDTDISGSTDSGCGDVSLKFLFYFILRIVTFCFIIRIVIRIVTVVSIITDEAKTASFFFW